MKNLFYLLTVQLLLVSFIYGQADTVWTNTYGDIYSNGANAVCETFDGGLLLGGYTYIPGAGFADIYVVKTDNQGNELFENTFGGSGWDIAYSVCNAVDNDGYIITGHTTSSGEGSKDVFLLKTDLQLNELWFKTYGGPERDAGRSVKATLDGGYIICGYTESFGAGEDDIYLIKTDADGDTVWTKTIGCEKSDVGHSVCETSDGHFIIAGSSGLYDSPGIPTGKNNEIYVVKTDLSGNIINKQSFWVIDDDQGDFDAAYSVCETSDGNYVVSGSSSAESVEVMDLSVIKMDTSLTSIWKRRKEEGFYDFGYSVCEAVPGGGIIICGNFNIASTSVNQLLILRLDENGIEVWRNTYGGIGSDGARCITKTSDGDFAIAGYTSSFGAGSYDMWLLKIHEELTGIGNDKIPNSKSYYLEQNFPNPFNPTTTISFFLPEAGDVKLKLFDINGIELRVLINNKVTAGEHRITLDADKLSSGIYFYQLKTSDFTQTKKLVLLK